MVKLSNFSGLMELAFGLNALFYFLEVLPPVEERLKRLMEETHRLYDKLGKITKNGEPFPFGLLIGSSHQCLRYFWSILFVAISVTLFGIMVFCGFKPDVEVRSLTIWLILGMAYLPPLIAFGMHQSLVNKVTTLNLDLENRIQAANNEHGYLLEYVLKDGKKRTIITPSKPCLEKGLTHLTLDSSVTHLILGKRGAEASLQVSGRRRAGYAIAYRENSCDRVTKERLSRDTTIELLSLYMEENLEWKDLADWVTQG